MEEFKLPNTKGERTVLKYGKAGLKSEGYLIEYDKRGRRISKYL